MSPDKVEDWNELRPFCKAVKLRRVPSPFRSGPSRHSLTSPALGAPSLRLRNDCPHSPAPIRQEFLSFRRSSPRDYQAANLRPKFPDTVLARMQSRKRTEASPSRPDVSLEARDRIGCARSRGRQPAPES